MSGELVSVPSTTDLPALLDCHPHARFAWSEFFHGHIRNKHTRLAYERAVRRFLGWCDDRRIPLTGIEPGHVGEYLDQSPVSIASRKLALAALRAFFDVMVNRHVLLLNPALTVRGERLQVIEGKTPEITEEQVRTLLASIDTSMPVGLRDKAVIATLIYTAARAGAVANLRLRDLQWDGAQYSLRFHEKGGKARAIPVRHDLQHFIVSYLTVLGADKEPRDSPFFRTVAGRTGRLTSNPLTAIDICRIVKRRLADAGLPTYLSPHSFRVASATNLLSQGVPSEDVQHLLGHADPRTSRLYDRRQRQVTRNTVERISL